jgi:hypothetical protein
MVACAPPDGPGALDLRIPAAALELLVPDSARSVMLGSGVVYRYYWSAAGPWAVHLVQAGVTGRCDLRFDVLLPAARAGGGRGRATVSEMVTASDAEVLAAVNADFFTADGAAVGSEVVGGTVRSATARPTFAWRAGTDPWMGISVPDGDGLRLGWSVPGSGDGRTVAVGGFPDLIDDGERVGDLEVTERPSFAAARHPRSAVGYDEDTGQIWLVVVDGRQLPHSAGMSLPELARLFEALGAEEALNLDGGGSSALVVGEGPVNRPSDATGERAVVNALALIRDGTGCRTP